MGDRLATIDMGQKVGAAVMPLSKAELGTHLTQCRQGWGLPPCKWNPAASSRLATTDMGRKLGACPLLGGGKAGSPSNTKSPGTRCRPTFVPSGIIIHPSVWRQTAWTNKRVHRKTTTLGAENGESAIEKLRWGWRWETGSWYQRQVEEWRKEQGVWE